ncbi:MFS transporter, DHA1 family, inner membrane transport protein [Actinopolymorpha cephalotaxi]|uniref:DHA1 family inner membrane transport protein n=1 Tax=Actinopolymorpha cephalotaxi TaxID=504797 RepID=A0A1I2X1U4_9ACTN|nr:MFS transporter [Actinopolymorpha cephalotaxi]NYH85181.1 DHA1 family inner membrane transport protein [Actinopolymorpha cephalotaxi]SFH05911.1 MFS transporter, DHA1 family, inner membrane transport protein [Actinopolymorpha cephalotaxi]
MLLPVLSLMLVVFSFTTGEFVISGILPEVADGLSVSVAAAGLLASAYAVGMIVGGPVVTVMTARLARKPLVVGLVAVSLLANAASALAPNYPALLASRLAAGLVVATFFAVAIATAVSMAPPTKQASTVAKVTLGMNLGIILGAPIGTFVGQHFGWRATFAAIAVLTLGALAMVLRFVPAERRPDSGSVVAELRVFADRNVQLALALTAVGNVGIVTVFIYLAPLLTDAGGFAATSVPVLLLVYGAGAVVGNFAGGRLSDRAGVLSLVGLLAALAAVLLLAWLSSGIRPVMVVLVFGMGLLGFAIIPGMQTRVVTAAATAPTLAVAVNASGFQLAAAFAGWLGGRLVDSAPGTCSIYLAGALLTLAGLAVALHALRRDRQAVRVPAT